MTVSLLSGPSPESGMESYAAHVHRLGPLPEGLSDLIGALERSSLRGRGGAGFPAAVKWRAVASQQSGTPIVLANGAEGEPLSRKDRMLMEQRPHLVIDGALLAADAVGAGDIILYVGADHSGAVRAMHRAVNDRPARERERLRLVSAPVRYVSGEETAAVHFINAGIALPTAIPPRPFERGVDGRPTLVQNVETLAHAAMIARYGDAWFRSLGVAVARAPRSSLSAAPCRRRCSSRRVRAAPWPTRSTPRAASPRTATRCCSAVTSAAGSSPRRHGRCHSTRNGCEHRALRSDAAWSRCCPRDGVALSRRRRSSRTLPMRALANAGPARSDCVPSRRRSAESRGSRRHPATSSTSGGGQGCSPGRGACRHPDGAAGLLASAQRVFGDEFLRHDREHRCSAGALTAVAS